MMPYIKNIISPLRFILFFIAHYTYATQMEPYTPSGHELGISLSHYNYTEPDIPFSATGSSSVVQTAAKLGLDYSYTWTNVNKWSLKGNIRYAGGKTDYHYHDETINKITDWYTDTRLVVGKDIPLSGFSTIVPQIGLGYRYLVNDSSNRFTTKGNYGYLRENSLIYLPIGLSHRMLVNDKHGQLISNVEADILLEGKQYSHLSETIVNTQHHGYGLRASLAYQEDHWSIGPWLTYWKISDSNIVQTNSAFVMEPKNNTTEVGLNLGYVF
jgi:hypothetical protein